jgi:hypothetical protein
MGWKSLTSIPGSAARNALFFNVQTLRDPARVSSPNSATAAANCRCATLLETLANPPNHREHGVSRRWRIPHCAGHSPAL